MLVENNIRGSYFLFSWNCVNIVAFPCDTERCYEEDEGSLHFLPLKINLVCLTIFVIKYFGAKKCFLWMPEKVLHFSSFTELSVCLCWAFCLHHIFVEYSVLFKSSDSVFFPFHFREILYLSWNAPSIPFSGSLFQEHQLAIPMLIFLLQSCGP